MSALVGGPPPAPGGAPPPPPTRRTELVSGCQRASGSYGIGLEFSVFLHQSFVPSIVPTDLEYQSKERARLFLERLTGQLYPKAKLLPFGSMANGFALSGCDMDLCCLVPERTKQVTSPTEFVSRLGQLIQQQSDFLVKVLGRARIPIIKLVLPDGLNCDIGFENRLALENTRLLLTYAMIDPRLRIIVLLIKVWAKKRNLNNPYRGTLSSYGYVLLVIHFLSQVVKPPILPNLQQLVNNNTNMNPITEPNQPPSNQPPTNTTQHSNPNQNKTPINPPPPPPSATANATANATASGPIGESPSPVVGFFDDLERLGDHWQGTNQDCVGDLVIEFFKYFATDYIYHEKVISIRSNQGQLVRQAKHWYQQTDGFVEGVARDLHFLCIEDPFQLDYNVARTVTKEGLHSIRTEFLRAYKILSGVQTGQSIVNVINVLLEPDIDSPPHPAHYDNPRPRSAPSPRMTPISAPPGGPPSGYDIHRFFQSSGPPPAPPPPPPPAPAPIFPERDRVAVALANEITFGNFSSRGRSSGPGGLEGRQRGRSVPHFSFLKDKDGQSSILFGEIKVIIPTTG